MASRSCCTTQSAVGCRERLREAPPRLLHWSARAFQYDHVGMQRRTTGILGAAASVALVSYAGRHNPSRLLLLLFAGWVAAPFLATGWAKVPTVPSVIILAGSLTIYAAVALDLIHPKLGFIFLVVPFISWGVDRDLRGNIAKPMTVQIEISSSLA